MAILAAFNSPAVEIVGLTTLFGNVRTPQATANALVLRELAGSTHVSGARGVLHKPRDHGAGRHVDRIYLP